MKWTFVWLELFFGGMMLAFSCRMKSSNIFFDISEFWLWVQTFCFVMCRLRLPNKNYIPRFLIWPCKGSKNKKNKRILTKSLFWFHTQFLFFLLSVSGLFFHGAQSYNWWIHKLANIEPTNYALLFWLVYLSLLQYFTK